MIAEKADLALINIEQLNARPLSDWHEDIGDVLWWCFPVCEPPYVGSPLNDDFPDYCTHWTPFVIPNHPNSGNGWQWTKVDSDTAYAPPFGTVRVCRVCGCLVAGGPTACARCADSTPDKTNCDAIVDARDPKKVSL